MRLLDDMLCCCGDCCCKFRLLLLPVLRFLDDDDGFLGVSGDTGGEGPTADVRFTFFDDDCCSDVTFKRRVDAGDARWSLLDNGFFFVVVGVMGGDDTPPVTAAANADVRLGLDVSDEGDFDPGDITFLLLGDCFGSVGVNGGDVTAATAANDLLLGLEDDDPPGDGDEPVGDDMTFILLEDGFFC